MKTHSVLRMKTAMPPDRPTAALPECWLPHLQSSAFFIPEGAP